MSSFTRDDIEVKREEVDQLCCFDRMKKLIMGKDGEEEQGRKDQISAIAIEQKINKLEGKLRNNKQNSINNQENA